jgi:hypothetical protein
MSERHQPYGVYPVSGSGYSQYAPYYAQAQAPSADSHGQNSHHGQNSTTPASGHESHTMAYGQSESHTALSQRAPYSSSSSLAQPSWQPSDLGGAARAQASRLPSRGGRGTPSSGLYVQPSSPPPIHAPAPASMPLSVREAPRTSPHPTLAPILTSSGGSHQSDQNLPMASQTQWQPVYSNHQAYNQQQSSSNTRPNPEQHPSVSASHHQFHSHSSTPSSLPPVPPSRSPKNTDARPAQRTITQNPTSGTSTSSTIPPMMRTSSPVPDYGRVSTIARTERHTHTPAMHVSSLPASIASSWT